MADEDLRKWNLQTVAKRLRELEGRFEEGIPVHTESVAGTSGSRMGFEDWFERAVLSLLEVEGYSVASLNRLPHLVRNLGNVYMAVMAARGASPDEIARFYAQVDERSSSLVGVENKVRAIRGLPPRPDPTDNIGPPKPAPVPVDTSPRNQTIKDIAKGVLPDGSFPEEDAE